MFSYHQKDRLLLHCYHSWVRRQMKSCLAGHNHYPVDLCLDSLHAIVVSDIEISPHQEWP